MGLPCQDVGRLGLWGGLSLPSAWVPGGHSPQLAKLATSWPSLPPLRLRGFSLLLGSVVFQLDRRWVWRVRQASPKA